MNVTNITNVTNVTNITNVTNVRNVMIVTNTPYLALSNFVSPITCFGLLGIYFLTVLNTLSI